METIGLFEMLFQILGPVFILALLMVVLALLARFLFQRRVEQEASPEE